MLEPARHPIWPQTMRQFRFSTAIRQARLKPSSHQGGSGIDVGQLSPASSDLIALAKAKIRSRQPDVQTTMPVIESSAFG